MLPIQTDFAPMEAQTAPELPRGERWQYEPKWDGFRCLAFRDGGSVELMSKSGQPLGRYFPEMTRALLTIEAKRFVLDGELIVAGHIRLDFDALLQRIHPAASRIKKLSIQTPATFVVFDLLVNEKAKDLTRLPLEDRRGELERFAKKFTAGNPRIHLSPRTMDFEVARQWFKRMAGPLDGVIAKRIDEPYASGERGGAMLKIKNLRTADCVVGGFRYGTKSKQVASLLLGLYDKQGLLHHVGFTSGLANTDKAALTKKLESLIEPPGFTGSAPGGPSRWSKSGRSADWHPLKAVLVVEVQYDHFTGHRFRHGTRLLRWRPDKKPRNCKMEQVKKESASPLTLLD
ncbi:MAG TPA: ATP-dependent DNA ligase [Tepidisphaeraceae bacterium]|nr:ATP-dependent DNA ligase [Tepidisphaeraceae bacterium]